MRIVNPTAIKGEEIACEFLKKKGYKILDRNWRKGYGEIDIIAIKDNILVFVEVKSTRSAFLKTPLEHINFFKLKTLTNGVQFYKSLHPELPEQLRIDAVSVVLDSADALVSIDHIENISV